LMLVDGKKQYVFDENGKRYLDFFSGVATVNVGHCHPKINAAVEEQMNKIGHTSPLYVNDQIVEYAMELVKKFPSNSNLSVCHFVNSGSEANDLAMLMARLYTNNNDILSLRNGYHGMSAGTMGLTALSTWKFPVSQGHNIKHVQHPDGYRGRFLYNDAIPYGLSYAQDVKDVIDHLTPGTIAGFICEPIQGVGGIIEAPKDYLQTVYKHVKNAGGVCISDEVQTGFGRIGTHWWGFESLGVTPDIVTMAKGIGNGWPLACVVTTPQISATMSKKYWFNTYGGHPIIMAAGKAVLEIIESEKLIDNTNKTGTHFKQGLLALKQKYPNIIGDVRGRGLMLGMEIVSDSKNKTPSAPFATKILEESKNKGLLIGKGGLNGNILRIQPVLCISKEDVDFALSVFNSILSNLH